MHDRAEACTDVDAGQKIWIHLTAAVSTYTAKPGDTVFGVLTEDIGCGRDVMIPAGSPVQGVVVSRRKVGFGIRHETAALEMEFQHATVNGVDIPLKARVEEVENAREMVHNGVIEGIRSSSSAQGRITSRLIHLPTWNPYTDPVLIAFKAAFPVFPEPEIYYPAGTGIRLLTTAPISAPVVAHAAPEVSADEIANLDTGLTPSEQLVSMLPTRVKTRRAIDADLVNLVFVGDRDVVENAFLNAGWNDAEAIDGHSVTRDMYALLNHSGYERQPMSTFYLNGVPQELSLQKNLNSYDRRDHLRMWRWSAPGMKAPVWVSSSTHDTGATLTVRYRGFMHHIAADVDSERETVIRDLTFAGCVASVNYVSRPDVPQQMLNSTGDTMRTDGAIAIVRLRPCQPQSGEQVVRPNTVRYRPGNHLFRFARRQILTFRNDIFRSNILYTAYDGARMGIASLRERPLPASRRHNIPSGSIMLSRYEEGDVVRSSRPYSIQAIH